MFFTTESYESLYCMRCHRDGLWTTLRCDRELKIDNGPEQPDGLASRYEGICLRCCDHNHG